MKYQSLKVAIALFASFSLVACSGESSKEDQAGKAPQAPPPNLPTLKTPPKQPQNPVADALSLERKASQTLKDRTGIELLSFDAVIYDWLRLEGIFDESVFQSSPADAPCAEISEALSDYLNETEVWSKSLPSAPKGISNPILKKRTLASQLIQRLDFSQEDQGVQCADQNLSFRSFVKQERNAADQSQIAEDQRNHQELVDEITEKTRREEIRKFREQFLSKNGQTLPPDSFWEGLSSDEYTQVDQETVAASEKGIRDQIDHEKRSSALKSRAFKLLTDLDRITITTSFWMFRPVQIKDYTPEMKAEQEELNQRRAKGLKLSARRGQIRTEISEILQKESLDLKEEEVSTWEVEVGILRTEAAANRAWSFDANIQKLQGRYNVVAARWRNLSNFYEGEELDTSSLVNKGSEANLLWVENKIAEMEKRSEQQLREELKSPEDAEALE